MSLKGQKTTSDYLEWDKVQALILKLERDGNDKFALLIACGVYLGMRIGDLRVLKWEQLLNKEKFTITEQKTGKERTLQIHPELQGVLCRHFENTDGDLGQFLFVNRFGNKPINVQYINSVFKIINKRYKLGINFSTHSLRKAFSRRIYENSGCSEKSLLMLGTVLNHSSIAVTKRYIGIRQEEIANVYLSL